MKFFGSERSFLEMLAFGISALYLVVALSIFLNHAVSPVIWSRSDQQYARMAYCASYGDYGGYGSWDDMNEQTDPIEYTPLSIQINALIIKYLGTDLRFIIAAAGIVGFLSILFLSLSVYEITGNKFLAFIAAGMFAGIDVGYWFCEVGPNSFQIMFALLGLYLLIRNKNDRLWLYLLATFVFFCSFWSKQTSLVFVVAGLFYITMRDYKKGLLCLGLFVALFAGLLFYFVVVLKTDFIYRVFIWPTEERMQWDRVLFPSLFPNVIGSFAVIIALLLAGVFSIKPSLKNYVNPYFIMLGASCYGPISAAKYGSGMGHCIMLFAMMILCGLYFLNSFVEKKAIMQLVAGALLCVQLITLFHNYLPYYVTKEDAARFEHIIGLMKDRNAYFYGHPYYSVYLNRPSVIGPITITKFFSQGKIAYPEKMAAYWAKDPFDIIIMYLPFEVNSSLIKDRLEKNYRVVDQIPPCKYDNVELRKHLVVFEKIKR